MSDYFAMGGYAVFIWPSYALGFVLLAGAFLLAARRLHAAEAALDTSEDDESRGA
jgi:heme exporter protein D